MSRLPEAVHVITDLPNLAAAVITLVGGAVSRQDDARRPASHESGDEVED